ncbi:hypothetical protein HOLleu_31129 [Holothuria leucospilota]|uniref:Uncharacterized protein n=1 Tax=Holothuria leucospilota TaxID=206669 RepID=A0A9Q1BLE0_HOLLE|nr:hypothetical protein HOLleu_31129 [Holothuria leucospilota]
METLATIIPTLMVSMWAASLELNDAYLHIPIAPASRRFLALEYQGETFKFTALPFSLSKSPGSSPGSQGQSSPSCCIAAYCSLLTWTTGSSWGTRRLEVRATVTLLTHSGWVINWEKSRPIPSQSLTYLGAQLDMAQGRAFPSEERITSLNLALDGLLRTPWSPPESGSRCWAFWRALSTSCPSAVCT